MSDQQAPTALPWEANFRAQMKRFRESSGMTQTDLAKAVKREGLPFHQQTIQRIEAGERPVRLDEAFVIANVLELDLPTMASSDRSTFAGVQLVVDRLRRESDLALDALPAVYESVTPRLQDLMSALTDVLAEDTRPTPRLAWAAAWTHKVLTLALSLDEVLSGIEDVAARRSIPVSRLPYLTRAEVAQAMKALRDAGDILEPVSPALRPEVLSKLAGHNLYDLAYAAANRSGGPLRESDFAVGTRDEARAVVSFFADGEAAEERNSYGVEVSRTELRRIAQEVKRRTDHRESIVKIPIEGSFWKSPLSAQEVLDGVDPEA